MAPVIGGSGGGRPQLAQAGSKEIGKMGQVMQKANQLIRGKVEQ